MGNSLKIRDLVTFSLMDNNLIKVRDDYERGVYQAQAGSQEGGLLVRIAATHSGIITRNNGFYLPQMMRDGAKTFTDNYPKPILLHHEERQDNIGRVIQAGYVDTSNAIQDELRNSGGLVVKDRFGKEKGKITDESLRDFVDGRMPFGMQVDFVHTLLQDSVLQDPDFDGLGHIQLIARITDKKAIEKFLDGRYLTGSVGATTNRAVCSVCKTDWTDSGQCEHKPGGQYDGTKCFIIAGKLMYDEYSVVNTPADRHSKVLELNYNGQTTVVDFATDFTGRLYEARLEFPQYDSTMEEGLMADKKTGEETVVVQDSHDAAPENEPTVQDAKGDGSPETVVEDGAGEGSAKVKPEGDQATGETAVQDSETPTPEYVLDDIIDKYLGDEEPSDEERAAFEAGLWVQAQTAFEDGAFTLEDLGVEKLEDAKVDPEKKLPRSVFCGPKDSFPAPNPAYVVAAQQLVDGYKGETDLSEVRKNLDRKAKAMGFQKKEDNTEGEASKDAISHARIMHMILATLEENTYSTEEALSDDEKKMLGGILKRLSGLVGKDSFKEAVMVEVDVAFEGEKALLDEIERNEVKIGALRDQIDALRKEYNDLFKDLETVQDSLGEAKSEARKAKEAHAGVLKALRDQKVEATEWEKITDGDLDSEVKRLTEEVDMEKIADKLGDGMARNPDGTVEDPTVIQDGNKDQKRTVTEAKAKEVQEHWHYLALKKGAFAADAWLRQQNLEGAILVDDNGNPIQNPGQEN